nr:MAG TPA: hypothetical protein [Caudoviricetes sp.]
MFRRRINKKTSPGVGAPREASEPLARGHYSSVQN